MNDLQKKLAIVGLTSFIVWFFLAIGNEAFYHLFEGDFENFSESAIYTSSDYSSNSASWPHLITFMTWLCSLIAFNVYKD